MSNSNPQMEMFEEDIPNYALRYAILDAACSLSTDKDDILRDIAYIEDLDLTKFDGTVEYGPIDCYDGIELCTGLRKLKMYVIDYFDWEKLREAEALNEVWIKASRTNHFGLGGDIDFGQDSLEILGLIFEDDIEDIDISNFNNLDYLLIDVKGNLGKLGVNDCPRLEDISITPLERRGSGTIEGILLSDLPSLRIVETLSWFDECTGAVSLENTPSLKGISVCYEHTEPIDLQYSGLSQEDAEHIVKTARYELAMETWAEDVPFIMPDGRQAVCQHKAFVRKIVYVN